MRDDDSPKLDFDDDFHARSDRESGENERRDFFSSIIRRLELDDDDDDDENDDDDVLTTTTTKRKRRTHFKVPIEKSVGRVSERDVRAKRAHPGERRVHNGWILFQHHEREQQHRKEVPGE